MGNSQVEVVLLGDSTTSPRRLEEALRAQGNCFLVGTQQCGPVQDYPFWDGGNDSFPHAVDNSHWPHMAFSSGMWPCDPGTGTMIVLNLTHSPVHTTDLPGLSIRW